MIKSRIVEFNKIFDTALKHHILEKIETSLILLLIIKVIEEPSLDQLELRLKQINNLKYTI